MADENKDIIVETEDNDGEWQPIEVQRKADEKAAKVDYEVETSSEDTENSVKEEEEEEVQQTAVKNDLPELDGITTKGAEKRIRQLVKQRKDRERELTVSRNELNELNQQLSYANYSKHNSEETSLGTTENLLNDRLKMSQESFKSAFESGDQDKLLKAQETLSDAQTELKFLKRQKEEVEQQKFWAAQEMHRQPQQPEEQPVEETKQFDPKAQDWAARNQWFGQDRVATAAALSIDAELKEQGYDPSSNEFYKKVDERLKEEFPNKFSTTDSNSEVANPSKPRQAVAGQSRNPASKKVKLSRDDVNLAKKWGIPLESFATEKAKMEKADGDYTPIT